MKYLLQISISLVLLFCNSLHAQSFVEFPDSNALWITGYSDYPDPVEYSAASYADYGDTAISGFQYRKVYDDNSLYIGAYRKIGSDTVMFVPTDSTSEFLLYDFSIQVGDSRTVWSSYWPYGLSTVTCIGIYDSVEIDGYLYKDIDLGAFSRWESGIGSTTGPFLIQYASMFGFYFLQCVIINGNTVYSPYNNCFAVGVNYVNETGSISLSPNPVQSLLSINLSSAIAATLTMYDALGRKVKLCALAASQKTFELSVAELPAGVYLVAVESGGRVWSEKVVKGAVR